MGPKYGDGETASTALSRRAGFGDLGIWASVCYHVHCLDSWRWRGSGNMTTTQRVGERAGLGRGKGEGGGSYDVTDARGRMGPSVEGWLGRFNVRRVRKTVLPGSRETLRVLNGRLTPSDVDSLTRRYDLHSGSYDEETSKREEPPRDWPRDHVHVCCGVWLARPNNGARPGLGCVAASCPLLGAPRAPHAPHPAALPFLPDSVFRMRESVLR